MVFCLGHRSTVFVGTAKHFLRYQILSIPQTSLILQDWSLKRSSNHENPYVRKFVLQSVIKEKHDKLNEAKDVLKQRGKHLLENLNETKDLNKKESIIERENIWTIPNILCATRILVTPYLGYLIIHKDFNTAFCIMGLAGITDLLDGLIARNFEKQSSKLGSFLDPMADKILISTMFLTLTYVELIPLLLTTLIVFRDITLASAGFYIRYKSLPPPRTLSRYFDVTHATAQLAPTLLGKISTLVQLSTAAITLSAHVLQFIDHPLVYYLWWLTGATTLLSGISYIYTKNTFTYLKQKGKHS